jgi:putative SOS response-associated peptidase YedK
MCFSIKVDRNLNRVASSFRAQISETEFWNFLDLQKKSPKLYKSPDTDDRIYPNYYAPVITMEQGKRTLRPMRYRLRPHDALKEVPSKYNLFNARLDALETRKSWSSLFMRNHCLVPFTHFYEWVEYQGKKRQIRFTPENNEMMWAPALWDYWQSSDRSQMIHSFAIITTDPPPEIEGMGHDRCPLFLEETFIDNWLAPQKDTRNHIFEILSHKTPTLYKHNWVA